MIIQLHDIASYMIMLHRGRLTDAVKCVRKIEKER